MSHNFPFFSAVEAVKVPNGVYSFQRSEVMRINSEEAMIKAILVRREAKVSWAELSRRNREQTEANRSSKATAAEVAGA